MPPLTVPFGPLPAVAQSAPVEVKLWDDEPRQNGNAVEKPQSDGGVIVDFNPKGRKQSQGSTGRFDANLAEKMDESELDEIASDLLRGIAADDQSRQDWLTTHAEGIKLLGLVLEDSGSAPDASSAQFEGLSTSRHPLMLEACLLFQAEARAALLPAAGPVKVRDDQPPKPEMPAPIIAPTVNAMMGHNGGHPLAPPPMNGVPIPPPPPPAAAVPPMGVAQAPAVSIPPNPAGGPTVPGGAAPPVAAVPLNPPLSPAGQQPLRSTLADALEKDFNHYLTTTAKEYYPDTDRMAFLTGFGGQGVKKVYNCPLRRRPVSESISVENFIVSDALTDLGNAARITHEIKMRPSVLRRMQLLGVYRDIDLSQPVQAEPNPVTEAKSEIVGVTVVKTNPEDQDYNLYECYCELELDEFAPPQFKRKGVALPYRVTIDRDSRKILEIRRNWREDDKECVAREFFVDYSYVKAFGFYGIGLLHILGNTTRVLTAAWRELIDSGMYANFPGFLYNKGLGRQITNQFRPGPGQGVGFDAGLQSLKDAVVPMPYKDLGPQFVAFIEHVEQLGQRVGSTANVGVGEGKQDAPVGTTLALIEQATKQIGAALKRFHTAQAKEFQLLADRFRDDPGAFWRFNKKPAMPWEEQQFLAALNDFDLVPVSDPNNPTRMHRLAKAQLLFQMAQAAPLLFKLKNVATRIGQAYDIEDFGDLLSDQDPSQQQGQQPQQQDQGKVVAAQVKAHGDQLKAQTTLQTAQMAQQTDAAEIAARIHLAEIQQETERLRLAQTLAIHGAQADDAQRSLAMKLASDHAQSHADRMHELAMQQSQQEQPNMAE
ncbi:MAG: hypothetical protein KGL39_06480 [Patescibacteria group bacterium]|nr:hypothetical protein [Patescibacteria group bacterium]